MRIESGVVVVRDAAKSKVFGYYARQFHELFEEIK